LHVSTSQIQDCDTEGGEAEKADTV